MSLNGALVGAGSFWTICSVLYLSSSTLYPETYYSSWQLALGMILACLFCLLAGMVRSRHLRMLSMATHLSVPLIWFGGAASGTGAPIQPPLWAAIVCAAIIGTVVADLGLYLNSKPAAVEASALDSYDASLNHAHPLEVYESGGFPALAAADSSRLF